MKFSDCVSTETAGNSVDPLGYLKPSGEVSSGPFRLLASTEYLLGCVEATAIHRTIHRKMASP